MMLRRWLWRLQRDGAVDREIRRNVPRGCWRCELLGMCRDKTQRDARGYWKCTHGCIAKRYR